MSSSLTKYQRRRRRVVVTRGFQLSFGVLVLTGLVYYAYSHWSHKTTIEEKKERTEWTLELNRQSEWYKTDIPLKGVSKVFVGLLRGPNLKTKDIGPVLARVCNEEFTVETYKFLPIDIPCSDTLQLKMSEFAADNRVVMEVKLL